MDEASIRDMMTPESSSDGLRSRDGLEAGSPCGVSICKNTAVPGVPFCYQHLASLGGPGPRKQTTNSAPSHGGTGGDCAGSETKEASSVVSRTRGAGFGTPYLRRKTAPNGNMRFPGSTSSRTSTPSTTKDAPSTPRSRLDKANYNFGSNTLTRGHEPSNTDKYTTGDGNRTSGAFLTPTDSPPELRVGSPGKRARSDFQGERQLPDGRRVAQTPPPTRQNFGDVSGNQPTFYKESAVENPQQKPQQATDHAQTETPHGHGLSINAMDWRASNREKQKESTGDERAAEVANRVHVSEHRDGSPMLSKEQRKSSLFRRLKNRDRDWGRDPQSASAAACAALDAYVYGQNSDVAPLPPPPGVLVPSRAFSLDAYIYRQKAGVAPLPPPPSGAIRPKTAMVAENPAAAALAAVYPSSEPSASPSSASRPSFIYAHIDPRIHWTKARPREWHEAKQGEIRARGGRKANLQKAAQRMADQRRRRRTESGAGGGNDASPQDAPTSPPPPPSPAVWEGDLPPEVLNNPAWVKFMHKFVSHEEERRRRHAQRAQRP